MDECSVRVGLDVHEDEIAVVVAVRRGRWARQRSRTSGSAEVALPVNEPCPLDRQASRVPAISRS